MRDMSTFYAAMETAMQKYRQMEMDLHELRGAVKRNSEDLAESFNDISTIDSLSTSVLPMSRTPMTVQTSLLSACLTFLPDVTFNRIMEVLHAAKTISHDEAVKRASHLLLPQYPSILSLFISVLTLN